MTVEYRIGGAHFFNGIDLHTLAQESVLELGREGGYLMILM